MADFFARGGAILAVIMLTTFFMWVLIAERYCYFFFYKNRVIDGILEQWKMQSLTMTVDTWRLRMIRNCHISQFRQKTTAHIAWIKVLITVSMLLGLLGTITGMIGVFEGMMLTQAGNVQVLASGVSRTVIPAMAGLVAALSGFYFAFQLERSSSREVEKLADKLVM